MHSLLFNLIVLFSIVTVIVLLTLCLKVVLNLLWYSIAAAFIAEGGILLGTLLYFILSAYYPLSHLLPLVAIVTVSACTMVIYTSLVGKIVKKKEDIHS